MFRRRWDDFWFWRRAVIANLIVISVLLVGYWLAWLAARGVVASESSPEYIGFEQAFPAADAWLLCLALFTGIALWRHRPAAFAGMLALAGAAIYLCALDVLYNLQHGIYGNGSGGAPIELAINVYTLLSGAGGIYFAWRFRRELLEPVPASPSQAPLR